MIHALFTGGPAEGIDDYAEAVDACEAYVENLLARRQLGLRHFLAVAKLRGFLSQSDGWDKRDALGWTELRRDGLLTKCNHVFSWKMWREQTLQALSATDEQVFYDGDTAASYLSIDTWAVHFDRVKTAPLTSSSWYRLMQQTDDSRIDGVLEFTKAVLPLEQIETGPADETGLGQNFRPHQALDWVLQDLRRFPGRGWRLIEAGVRSPVVRNRNMAINALAVWPRESWPPDAAALVLKAHELEPNDSTKRRLLNLLEGKPLS
jgi:hypothetical protein